MSFPVQSGPYSDPAIGACGETPYAVYCTSILPSAERFRHWYQYGNLSLAATALSVSIVLSILHFAWRRWQERDTKLKQQNRQGLRRDSRDERERRNSGRDPDGAVPVNKDGVYSFKRESGSSEKSAWSWRIYPFLQGRNHKTSIDSKHSSTSVGLPDFRRSIRTMSLYSKDDPALDLTPPLETNLCIIPLLNNQSPELFSQSCVSSQRGSNSQSPFLSNVVGLVEVKELDFGDLSMGVLTELGKQLDLQRIQKGYSGLVLHVSDDASCNQINELLQVLWRKNINLFAMCDPDTKAISSIDFDLLVGIIVENACILPSGRRRDFFQGEQLRSIMGRCADARIDQPGFFIGFLDLWRVRPTVSVARRAFKLAEYYGATLFHGPVSEEERLRSTCPTSLSGFDFLKSSEMVELQKSWRNETRTVDVTGTVGLYNIAPLPIEELQDLLPQVTNCLKQYNIPDSMKPVTLANEADRYYPPFDHQLLSKSDFWNVSGEGNQYSELGCFPLVRGVTDEQYESVLETQKHLRDLDKLHALEDVDILKLTAQFQTLLETTHYPDIIETLIHGLTAKAIRVFKGLDTGFRASSDGTSHLWGLSNLRDWTGLEVPTASTRRVDIFISSKAPSTAGTILHTFLADRGVPRLQRYEEELRFDHLHGDVANARLPTSIQSELLDASEVELLSLVHRLRESNVDHRFAEAIQDACGEILVNEASKIAWIDAHSRQFLQGSITMEELLRRRLETLVARGATKLPLVEKLVELYRAIDNIITDSLFFSQRNVLNTLGNALLKSYDPWKSWSTSEFVDINADLFGLMFFCALRRTAFEDVYIETTDRCPFFVTQPDQAAVFAELWVLGSQCDIYFGILPRTAGEIIYSKYREHLIEANPSPDTWNGKDLFTVYSYTRPENANGGYTENSPSTYRKSSTFVLKFGALSIFCVPAIMDVCLLTFLGRGFFLTAFMADDDRLVASYALLTSLLIAAGVTGWAGSVGGYYLYNHAHQNMNFFLVQRLSAGFVLTVAVALCGLVALTFQYSARVGAVFVAYLFVLSTYLTLLGVLATMHHKDCPMTSGRFVLWRTIPFLAISPILSSLINGHDLVIYLAVMYAFLLLLLFQYRNLSHEWSTWVDKVPHIKERDITTWYRNQTETDSDSSGDEKDKFASFRGSDAEAFFKRASELFSSEVDAARRKKLTTSGDSLVAKAAAGLPYAQWLLTKDDGSSTTTEPFTKTWLVQLDLELKRHEQLVRGLKEHNIFILWRYGKYDLGQNVGLFLVALMDHWIALATSSRLPYLTPYTEPRSRFAIGFCVLFFLMSTIAVDGTLQNYWEKIFTLSKERLVDAQHARTVHRSFKAQRRYLWLQGIAELLYKVLGVLGLTTLLLWLFVEDGQKTALYYLYVAGYSGVLLLSFNRCFTKSIRCHVLSIFIGALFGFTVGFILRGLSATTTFLYSEVLALVAASWTAAILTTLWVLVDPERHNVPPIESNDTIDNGSGLHIQKRLGASKNDQESYQSSNLSKIGGIEIKATDETFLSKTITTLLNLAVQQPSAFLPAAPWGERLIQIANRMWTDGNIVVTIANRQLFVQNGFRDAWSISQHEKTTLHITAGFLDETDIENHPDKWSESLAYLLTETIFHHTATSILGLTTSHAILAEHLLHDTIDMPKRIEFQLATEDEMSLERIIHKSNNRLLRHLCLDINADLEWKRVPAAVRNAVLDRVAGRPVRMTSSLNQWLKSSSKDIVLEDFCASLCLQISKFAKTRLGEMTKNPRRNTLTDDSKTTEKTQVRQQKPKVSSKSFGKRLAGGTVGFAEGIIKWFAILSGGASEVEREIWYKLRSVPGRSLIVMLLLLGWIICRWVKNVWITFIMIYRRPALQRLTRLTLRGATRTVVTNTITAELPRKIVTGFGSRNDTGTLTLDIFDGSLSQRPDDTPPFASATYNGWQLRNRQETLSNGFALSTFNYNSESDRWPISKDVVEPGRSMSGRYDKLGRVVNGNLVLGAHEYQFAFHYAKHPDFNKDLLRADFWQLQSPDKLLSVSWGISAQKESKKLDIATPSERVTRVQRQDGDIVYVTTFTYQHKRDPQTSTTLFLAGQNFEISNPPQLFDDEDELLKKPTNLSFDLDDLLIHHRPRQLKGLLRETNSRVTCSKFLSKFDLFGLSYFSRKQVHARVPTWRLRAELWKLWIESKNIDAVTACWLDEIILREESLLRSYWRYRDFGLIDRAKEALDRFNDQIVAAIEIPFEISQVCPLAIKPADLYTMGLGKDANQITNQTKDCYRDTRDRISVIFNDIGCWPDAPGGVSNCRRDLVNGHRTIRNHVLAEAANEYGISQYQTEQNVQSLKVLPLWGMDMKTAQHGLIDNLLQSQVDEKINSTSSRDDVVGYFIPLLRRFIKGVRTKKPSRVDLIECSNVLYNMCMYFQDRDYNRTWRSKEVEMAWVEAWLHPYNDPNIVDPSEFLDIERPSMSDMREALNLYAAALFIYAVQIPDECPRVFQSTHHGLSSLFGMVLKYRKGTTYGVWDHAILWRESCLNISPAQCLLPIPVQSMYLAGVGLAARLAYLHVDVIVPCTSVFNPTWEAEIGTDQGRLGSLKSFSRKIDPIVNGIGDMSQFEPMDEIRSEKPTVVMLSNVQFIKDIRTAVLAADIIVNQFGFKDYRLLIYGAQDRQPSYTLETNQLIQEKNLSGEVILAGFGKPKDVLKDAWLFMNSSLSEGLPLAIAEAALTGIPIVATEVGGTSLVLTDPDNKSCRYGEVVPPNNPMSLARAQLNLLAMLGYWTQYTRDTCRELTLPDEFTDTDVEWVTKRMYEKSEDRRRLGLMCRKAVLKGFHGSRYLREHEQMYWIQWHLARMKADEKLSSKTITQCEIEESWPLACVESKNNEDVGGEAGNKVELKRRRLRRPDSARRGELGSEPSQMLEDV